MERRGGAPEVSAPAEPSAPPSSDGQLPSETLASEDAAPAVEIPDRPSDWGSLVADLSRGREHPKFQVHDRTHVEFAVDYRMREGKASEDFVWESYFFAPESLRLHSRTYDKSDLYADLQSYVRFEVPDVGFQTLTEEPLDRVRDAIRSNDEKTAMREMRLYACMVRAAGVETRDAITEGLLGDDTDRTRAFALAARMVADTARIGPRLREVLALARTRPDPLRTAALWIDEDVSRLCETLLGNLVQQLRGESAPESLIAAAEQAAVAEAKYRMDSGLGGVGRIGMKSRRVEELEFRRHVLKRFTSSVLWLNPEVRPASQWLLHFLYALAASVAMGFAVFAALWNGNDWNTRGFIPWAVVVVIAYAAKDRIKAMLQTTFNEVVVKHFPDRHWKVKDRERGIELGEATEQSGFVPFKDVPADVLKVRRMTRVHELEEQARPETVVFHRKEVELRAARIADADPRFTALTEIFRLDLRRWLAHTDDPKREMVFADPIEGTVGAAVAPRVYNIGVVYRLRREDDENAPWHRVRIVVTRKGIRRIDPVI
jgi:hypothetical protein